MSEDVSIFPSLATDILTYLLLLIDKLQYQVSIMRDARTLLYYEYRYYIAGSKYIPVCTFIAEEMYLLVCVQTFYIRLYLISRCSSS